MQIRSDHKQMCVGENEDDALGSKEETFPDVSPALRRGIVKKKGTFEI